MTYFCINLLTSWHRHGGLCTKPMTLNFDLDLSEFNSVLRWTSVSNFMKIELALFEKSKQTSLTNERTNEPTNKLTRSQYLLAEETKIGSSCRLLLSHVYASKNILNNEHAILFILHFNCTCSRVEHTCISVTDTLLTSNTKTVIYGTSFCIKLGLREKNFSKDYWHLKVIQNHSKHHIIINYRHLPWQVLTCVL